MSEPKMDSDHDYELIEIFRPEVIWELHRCRTCGAEKLVKDESSEIRGTLAGTEADCG